MGHKGRSVPADNSQHGLIFGSTDSNGGLVKGKRHRLKKYGVGLRRQLTDFKLNDKEKIKRRLAIKDEAQLATTKSLCQLRVTCRYKV